MDELQPEELEELVQELQEESEEREALSPEVEELLRDLQPYRRYAVRREATERLGSLGTSHPRIVSALIAVKEFDENYQIRTSAAESLRAPVHQEILQEHPDLMQDTRSTAEQAAMEKLLRRLGPWRPEHTRRDAAEQLGKVGKSSPRIVEALIAASESPSDLVSTAAAKSLCAPVHQECAQQHPELAAAAESALQQVSDLEDMAKGAPVEQRIYPKPRIQERPLLGRILGVLGALFGLGLLVGFASGLAEGVDLKVLIVGFVGLSLTYSGLKAAGLDLKESLLALLHRRTWQGPQVTADGRITDRDIEEHEHKDDYGRVSYTYTHWITFGFPTTEGPVRLRASVDERRYGQLKRGQPVKVRYSQEDPRLALLEWEE